MEKKQKYFTYFSMEFGKKSLLLHTLVYIFHITDLSMGMLRRSCHTRIGQTIFQDFPYWKNDL